MKKQNTNKLPFDINNSNDALRRNPFIVPNGYFDDLSKKIQSEINLKENHTIDQNPFSVPDGYFDQLSLKIQSQITVENLKGKSPDNGFSVPEKYFDSLQSGILDKIRVENNTSIDHSIQVTPSKTAVFRLKKWTTYASAACILIALSIGGYLWKSQSLEEQYYSAGFSTIPDEEIINYLIQSVEEEDVLYLSQYFDVDHSGHDHSPGVGCHANEKDLEDYINYSL